MRGRIGRPGARPAIRVGALRDARTHRRRGLFQTRGEGRLAGVHGDAELHADLLAAQNIAGQLVILAHAIGDAKVQAVLELVAIAQPDAALAVIGIAGFAGIAVARIFGGQVKLVGGLPGGAEKGRHLAAEPGIDIGLAAQFGIRVGPVAEGAADAALLG